MSSTGKQRVSSVESDDRLPVPVNVSAPSSKGPPTSDVRPLILATHLVPTLSIMIFELLADAIEAATEHPVSVIYEPRSDRPVAKDVADFACLPAYSEWEDGDLLPVTFVFGHPQNTERSGNIYVEVISASNHLIEDVRDLRGHRCAIPNRGNRRGAASLLLKHLRTKGEGPAFFGDILDTDTQVAALQMVLTRTAEFGVIESPARLGYRGKHSSRPYGNVYIMETLGPLPPYAIYVKKSVPAELRDKVTSYLLNLKHTEHIAVQLSMYGILGFTTNSIDAYKVDENEEDVAANVCYY